MSSSDSEVGDVASHSESLGRLKDKDPDFYEFLKAHDEKLLNFGGSEDDNDRGPELVEDENELVAEGETTMLSSSYVKDLRKRVRTSPDIDVCKEVMSAFNIVVEQFQGEESIKIGNSDILNAVIKLCLVDLVPALRVVLKVSAVEREGNILDVGKCRAWKKLATCVKGYLNDLLKIMSSMTDPANLIQILKHTVHLKHYYAKSPKLSRLLLKKMITLWASKEEGVRFHALVVICSVTKVLDKDYLHYVSKHMYFAYVSNTKFTSASSWPIINFMKHSLVEIYALDASNAYECAFVYIRQLSIHLRNAVTVKKKEAFKVVYNWQYVHSIMLWAKLLGVNHKNESLRTLIYPLVQTTLGAIDLIPTQKYFPLRFHLVKTLIKLSEESGVFIPLLPVILQVLDLVDFQKKLGFSKKPVDFTCCLKLSKSQLQESGFKDAVINKVCELLLEYFRMNSHSIDFPEMALKAVVALKSFTKKCKVAKYCQHIKQVIEKISENSNFITVKRKSVNFKLTDDEQIKKWEENVLIEGTPLLKYCKPKERLCGQPPSKRLKISSKTDPEELMSVD